MKTNLSANLRIEISWIDTERIVSRSRCTNTSLSFLYKKNNPNHSSTIDPKEKKAILKEVIHQKLFYFVQKAFKHKVKFVCNTVLLHKRCGSTIPTKTIGEYYVNFVK